jgi:protoporphyrinogen oxidase
MKTAVIVGAGPAGLTAAYELLTRTDIHPVVLEASPYFGGISRTAVYRGNRMDIGGHRFFSKSSRVMEWWLHRMPLQKTDDNAFSIHYQGRSNQLPGSGQLDPETTDKVMLVRSRKSRIYWRRNLFNYPLSLSPDTVRKMGVGRMAKAGFSYLRASAMPIKPEQSLEHFLINRFGRELYLTFFKSYTEKVWGVPCHEIPADWGAQRIKGLSIRKAIAHALSKRKSAGAGNGDIAQKGVETSLIERFLYPKFGPGQMWETTADDVRRLGGEILMEHRATQFKVEGNRLVEVLVEDASGKQTRIPADYVFSSMPIRELMAGLQTNVPAQCRHIAETLPYRDFITVGLLVDKMKLQDDQGGPVRDNWIYIQEPDVLIGRLQVFNNWSPYLVADRSKTWLGLEYFCYENDDIWNWPDEKLVDLGRRELGKIDIIDPKDAIDGCAIRVKKTYPAYFGTYSQFGTVRSYLDTFENLFCVGRNGQHRYNNQDHSMLCAMIAVDNILEGITDRSAVWDVNTEEEYHEEAQKA